MVPMSRRQPGLGLRPAQTPFAKDPGEPERPGRGSWHFHRRRIGSLAQFAIACERTAGGTNGL